MAIYKRGEIWHVRAMVGGVTIARSTKTKNERTAKQLEAKWIAEVHSEVVVAGRKPLTVEKAIEAFLDSRRGTKGHPSAVQKLKVFEKFNSQMLHEVKARDILSHATNLVETGRYSVNTVNVSLVYWNAIHNFCTTDGYTPGTKVKRLKGGGGRVKFLTDDQVTKLLAALEPNCGAYREKRKAQDNYDFTVALLHTGARDQEMATMKMSQIDQAAGTITIHRSKGGTDTTLKMSKALIEVIARRTVAAEKPLEEGQTLHGRIANGFLFPERAKGRYNNEYLAKAAYRAGVPLISLHVLRHTFATQMLRAGANLLQIQRLLGHKNYASTLVYAHLAPDEAADFAVAVLDA
jgi:integrase